jgi:pilus assembly protein CpaB
MKLKTWLPICLALVLGVFAAILASSAMSSRKTVATVRVAVAKRAVPPGTALAATDVELRAIAAEVPPEGAHLDTAELIGRTAHVQLAKDKPVLETMLAAEGSVSGLQSLVPPGMRAMTIEVNEFSSVGGMIEPGSRVDVIATMQDARHTESMSRTVAQNVLVKAVGKDTGHVEQQGEEAKAAKSVTLLVTSKQAEVIQLSSLQGRPWLVLRGGTDNSVASLAGTTLTELRGAHPSIARDLLAAVNGMKPPLMQPTVAPSTQPVAPQPTNWLPARAVQTIRNTVETTVSVSPNDTQREAVTGATIEP